MQTVIPGLRKLGLVTKTLAILVFLAPTAMCRADYRVVNHSNEVVSVAVTYHLPNGHAITSGWQIIYPGGERTVYQGQEAKICVAILRGSNRVQTIPQLSHRTADRFVHATSAFANEDDNVPGVAKLSWDGQTYFFAANVPLPLGWYSQRFFILNGSETFEVTP